jgi:hypothetical protein
MTGDLPPIVKGGWPDSTIGAVTDTEGEVTPTLS